MLLLLVFIYRKCCLFKTVLIAGFVHFNTTSFFTWHVADLSEINLSAHLYQISITLSIAFCQENIFLGHHLKQE